MHLWTDYEGRTVDEHYILGKLLRSEGRNGFFATADKDGHPAVIRLTEAHFDEAELLHRWRQVADVHQDNLIEIEQIGQTTLEGVPLTYALMEPDDANLGDVLKERPLTTAETAQVAKAVLAALHALHVSGLVHEHIEPNNVLAVGETVKLRSDCVRECVPDGEFTTEETCAGLRRKDIHDFGTLLLRCLTLETEWSPAHNNLPDPFKRIIPRALDGSWTLEQLGTSLDPMQFAPKTAARPAYLAQAPIISTETGAAENAATSARPADAVTAPPAGPSSRPLVPPRVHRGAERDLAQLTSEQHRHAGSDQREPSLPVRSRYSPEPVQPTHSPSRAMWAICAAAALLILLVAWHLFSAKPIPAATSAVPAPIVSSGAVSRQGVPPQESAGSQRSSQPQRAAQTAPAEQAHAGGAPGWYVIAYTYIHQAQAETKAQRLRRTHDSLHPQVFTATGHGPYFVALGGPYSNQDQAETVLRNARRSGLPRDTFVRHF